MTTWLLACVIATQSADSVSITLPVVPARVAIKQLAEKTKLPLRIAEPMASQPTLLQVQDAETEVLLAHIASVLDGEWSEANGVITLVRTPAKNSELASRQTQELADRIVAARNKYLAAYVRKTKTDAELDKLIQAEVQRREDIATRLGDKLPEGGRVIVRSFGENEYSATESILHEFLEKVNPLSMANLLPGDRVVYCTTPNRMQVRLPVNLSASINSFIAEHNRLVDRASRRPHQSSGIEFQGGIDLNARRIQAVGKVLVTVNRLAEPDAYTIKATVLDPNGNVLGDAQQTLALEVPPADAIPVVGQVSWSPLSQSLLEIFTWRRSNTPKGGRQSKVMNMNGEIVTLTSDMFRPAENINPQLRAVLLDPESYDPLSFFVQDALLAAGKSRSANIVAVIPDTAFFSMANAMSPGGTNLSECLTNLSGSCEFNESGEFLLVKPREPLAAEMKRVDRKSLRELLQVTDSRGYLSLEPKLKYLSGTSQKPSSNGLDMVYLSLIHPSEAESLMGSLSQNYYLGKVLYTMFPQILRSNGSDFTLNFFQLTPAQQQFLHRDVFGRQLSAVIGKGTMIMMEMGPSSGPQPADITEALPNGIPQNAVFRVTLDRDEAVLAVVDGQKNGWAMGPSALGSVMGISTDPTFLASAFQLPNYQGFIPGESRKFTTELFLDGEPLSEAVFDDFIFDRAKKPVDYNGLSQSFRERAQMAQEQMRSMAGPPGGQQKPPIPPQFSR
ncbi:hypothetical protein QM565_29905 [Geitlerinema splendidum]|nr:hypothetical protein [Geitlerinema splendidum]